MLSKLLSAKALAALALGTASIGTAAAATGTLPDPAQAAAHRLVSAVPDADRAAGAATAGGAGAGAAAKAGADDHSAAGVVGLCRAYGSGQGGEQGGKLDATAFQRLAEAAGGADSVAAYCAKVTAAATSSRAAGASSRASAPTDPDLTGMCRAWLAAEQAGNVASLGKPVLDRLAGAAGGADAVAAYCAALAGQAPADQRAETTPPHPTGAPADIPTGGSSPSHPAPPLTPGPTPRG